MYYLLILNRMEAGAVADLMEISTTNLYIQVPYGDLLGFRIFSLTWLSASSTDTFMRGLCKIW